MRAFDKGRPTLSGWLIAGAIATSLTIGLQSPAVLAQPGVTGQWQTLPYLMPINPVHLALTRDGKVLVVAGSGNVATETTFRAAVWDRVAGTFTNYVLNWDMFCNGMSMLPDGRVFINGGNLQYDPFLGEPRNAVYDPATGTFTDIEDMADGRWYPTVTTLGNGDVMTFSGLRATGGTNTMVEIYSPGVGWSSPAAAGWTPPLYPRMHLSTDGRVFYSGSGRGSRFFNPATMTWTSVVATMNHGSSRTYGTSVLLPLMPADGYRPRVMILGGGNPGTATTETIDLSAPSPQWQFGPSMSRGRIQLNATILPNGRVLAVGGSVNDEEAASASLTADLYNPATNTFSSAGANVYPRLYHSGSLLLPDATVMLAGGNPTRGSYESHIEIYSPAYLFNSNGTPATRPTINSVTPGTFGYGQVFQVAVSNPSSIASVVLVRPGAQTHAFDMEQRLVGLSFTAGTGVLNVTAPPNGNIAPPGYYMLFILNTTGVPSVARFVQLSSSTSNQRPTAIINTPASNVTIAPGGTVNFSGSGTDPDGTISAYAWTFPGGSPSSSSVANPGVVTYATTGTYTASLTVTDNGGLTSASPATRTITVGNPPPGPSGLVAAYDFSEGTGPSLSDRTGAGHTGTIAGATWTTQGKFGNALTFDGANDWVTVNDANDLDFTSGLTLEAWVYPTTSGSWRNVLIKEQAGGEVYNLYANTDTSAPAAVLAPAAPPGIPLDARGSAALALNTWSHLAAAYDGTTLRLYVNGSLVGSRAVASPLVTSTGALRIGGNGVWGEFFAGRIDEVRLYNRALSVTEIQADMNAPIGPDTTPPTRSNGQPSGAQPAGTTQATLSLSTNEAATCRYATSAGVAWASMVNTFATTGGTTHSTTVSGLSNGNSYTYYVRCRDAATNANPDDFPIAFSVSNPPPPDTTPPTVSMTAPANNATVSGIVTVSANANDNIGVVGVQFLLGGQPLGPEDTTAPYSITWNSTTVANGGPYQLSARARDTANVTTSAVVSVTVNNTSLVAAYSFNEGTGTSLIDRTGTGHTGTISGATWTTQGKFGSALTFDGVNDWVTVNDANDLDFTTGLTIEAWVYPTTSGSWRNVLIKEQTGGEVYNLYANADTNAPAAYLAPASLPGVALDARGSAALPLNTWSHLAATYDGTTLRLYVNGSLVGSRAVASALVTSTGALRIGGNSVWGEFFTGRIDEVRLYNRALSVAEIQADMNAPIQP
jgi:hypothetical protein